MPKIKPDNLSIDSRLDLSNCSVISILIGFVSKVKIKKNAINERTIDNVFTKEKLNPFDWRNDARYGETTKARRMDIIIFKTNIISFTNPLTIDLMEKAMIIAIKNQSK